MTIPMWTLCNLLLGRWSHIDSGHIHYTFKQFLQNTDFLSNLIQAVLWNTDFLSNLIQAVLQNTDFLSNLIQAVDGPFQLFVFSTKSSQIYIYIFSHVSNFQYIYLCLLVTCSTLEFNFLTSSSAINFKCLCRTITFLVRYFPSCIKL